MATIVTAFYDINRSEKGDGRKIDDYKLWIAKTLQLNCKLVVFTEDKFVSFIESCRPKNYPLIIKNTKLKDAYYFKYLEKMKDIINSETYKTKIKHPNRVECILPEYNVIQYSKISWLKDIIQENPFKTSSFFWMDIGISRFFDKIDLNKPYPGNNIINKSNGKFIIQKRFDLETYDITDEFIWDSANLLKGSMFGGNKDTVEKISELLEDVFCNMMLANNNVNNEQLALALVWKKHKDLFYIIDDSTTSHIVIDKLLCH
jgi:hypothetical protein